MRRYQLRLDRGGNTHVTQGGAPKAAPTMHAPLHPSPPRTHTSPSVTTPTKNAKPPHIHTTPRPQCTTHHNEIAPSAPPTRTGGTGTSGLGIWKMSADSYIDDIFHCHWLLFVPISQQAPSNGEGCAQLRWWSIRRISEHPVAPVGLSVCV
ncbi:hypothetical protein BV22DRAFT_493847 [Leucogyrophana mollusca]|uniref:Uncharacterized protein n=1 Tax=Leucogyrophana mollusca TaxID=85980 RepID=A0ACB8BIM3_9AGAM|nr:hypothetical protein BV22DRAFT_493847 [Leucogyrophana mollusca]